MRADKGALCMGGDRLNATTVVYELIGVTFVKKTNMGMLLSLCHPVRSRCALA